MSMNTIANMSPDDFTKLLDEYFAPDAERKKMTEDEIREIATLLNDKVNIPLINETKEQKILVKIVLKIDRFLYDHLPNEFYDLVRSATDGDGITDEEATRLSMRLAKLANEKIDIPYIPEQAEYIAIRFVIGVIINAARKNWNLDKAKAAVSGQSEIPETGLVSAA